MSLKRTRLRPGVTISATQLSTPFLGKHHRKFKEEVASGGDLILLVSGDELLLVTGDNMLRSG